MKKLLLIGTIALSTLLFTGCGSNDDYYEPPIDDATTLFLIDQDGNSYGGIPYICDSMTGWSATRPNGEFTFFPPDNCEFDFMGYGGNYVGDPLRDEIIYIVDDLDRGKGGIDYECALFGVSSTYTDGSFDYDVDDRCTFYL